MSDLLKELIQELPRYAEDFVALLTGPKKFLRNIDHSFGIRPSVVFYAISTAISAVLYLPFVGESTNVAIFLIKAFTYGALTAVLSTLVYALSWRLVGSKTEFRHYVILTFYVFGMTSILWSLTTLGSKGLIKVYQPDLLLKYVQFMDSIYTADMHSALSHAELFKSDVPIWAFIFSAVGSLAAFSWMIATWGGYREISKATKARSFVAFLVWFVLMQPTGLVFVVGNRALDLPVF